MQIKKGSMVIVVGLVVLVLVLAGMVVLKFTGGSIYQAGSNSPRVIETTTEPELTKTDEVSDIERDLNSTSVENLDANVLGITSQVE